MVTITINGRVLEVHEGSTILEAARSNGIDIPTLCHWKGINEIGACRVCVVEVEGCSNLPAACVTNVADGMVIHTSSPRVVSARRVNAQLILSRHNCHCPSCVRNGNCALQTLSASLNITANPFPEKQIKNRFDAGDSPLIRDDDKCIQCMRCVSCCEKVQTLGIWQLNGSGGRTNIAIKNGVKITRSDCSFCGQCITHCPTGALRARDDTAKAIAALKDHNKTIIVQVAPAVRATWGENLGLDPEVATVGRLVAALHTMGFPYVFDTNFTADLTIMEEGSEFVARMQDGKKHKYPLFTSCCPGWVRFLKGQYPQLTDDLSTAKSPQQMFGTVAKTYLPLLLDKKPEDIYCVSIMPCIAKKRESVLPVMKDAGVGQDVDLVLTTRELVRMIKAFQIDVPSLPEEHFDSPLGEATGAGVIFGATGGVMEAALRSAHYLLTGKNPDPDAFAFARGSNGWRSFTADIAGVQVRGAVASGLGNARKLIEAILAGKVRYDFVEIMACPGGCAGGGGQPIAFGEERAADRADTLYELDKKAPKRFSHENPAVQKAYAHYFKHPLSEEAHRLLHTDHHAWEMPF